MREIKFRGKETVRHIIHADFLHDVQPETIGQYTGLKDRCNVGIYEGDILSIEGEPFGYIKFNPDGFFYIHTSTIFEYQDSIEVGRMIKQYPAEVIGNIYDNPDLLKVKDYEMSRTM